jgi:hypothetical protein
MTSRVVPEYDMNRSADAYWESLVGW